MRTRPSPRISPRRSPRTAPAIAPSDHRTGAFAAVAVALFCIVAVGGIAILLGSLTTMGVRHRPPHRGKVPPRSLRAR